MHSSWMNQSMAMPIHQSRYKVNSTIKNWEKKKETVVFQASNRLGDRPIPRSVHFFKTNRFPTVSFQVLSIDFISFLSMIFLNRHHCQADNTDDNVFWNGQKNGSNLLYEVRRRVEQGFAGLNLSRIGVLPGFIEFYSILLSFIGLRRLFDQVLPGFPGFYRVSLSVIRFDWVLPGFTGFT